MNKRKLFLLLVALLFVSCDWGIIEEPYITFKSVSQEYRDRYGSPEDIYTYDSGDYHTIDWWWWSKGFMVGFEDSPYNGVYGWSVESTYSFPPII